MKLEIISGCLAALFAYAMVSGEDPKEAKARGEFALSYCLEQAPEIDQSQEYICKTWARRIEERKIDLSSELEEKFQATR